MREITERSSIGYVEHVMAPALFEAAVKLDLGDRGEPAKRPVHPKPEWVKVKHREYSQMEGRGEMFHRRR